METLKPQTTKDGRSGPRPLCTCPVSLDFFASAAATEQAGWAIGLNHEAISTAIQLIIRRKGHMGPFASTVAGNQADVSEEASL